MQTHTYRGHGAPSDQWSQATYRHILIGGLEHHQINEVSLHTDTYFQGAQSTVRSMESAYTQTHTYRGHGAPSDQWSQPIPRHILIGGMEHRQINGVSLYLDTYFQGAQSTVRSMESAYTQTHTYRGHGAPSDQWSQPIPRHILIGGTEHRQINGVSLYLGTYLQGAWSTVRSMESAYTQTHTYRGHGAPSDQWSQPIPRHILIGGMEHRQINGVSLYLDTYLQGAWSTVRSMESAYTQTHTYRGHGAPSDQWSQPIPRHILIGGMEHRQINGVSLYLDTYLQGAWSTVRSMESAYTQTHTYRGHGAPSDQWSQPIPRHILIGGMEHRQINGVSLHTDTYLQGTWSTVRSMESAYRQTHTYSGHGAPSYQWSQPIHRHILIGGMEHRQINGVSLYLDTYLQGAWSTVRSMESAYTQTHTYRGHGAPSDQWSQPIPRHILIGGMEHRHINGVSLYLDTYLQGAWSTVRSMESAYTQTHTYRGHGAPSDQWSQPIPRHILIGGMEHRHINGVNLYLDTYLQGAWSTVISMESAYTQTHTYRGHGAPSYQWSQPIPRHILIGGTEHRQINGVSLHTDRY